MLEIVCNLVSAPIAGTHGLKILSSLGQEGETARTEPVPLVVSSTDPSTNLL